MRGRRNPGPLTSPAVGTEVERQRWSHALGCSQGLRTSLAGHGIGVTCGRSATKLLPCATGGGSHWQQGIQQGGGCYISRTSLDLNLLLSRVPNWRGVVDVDSDGPVSLFLEVCSMAIGVVKGRLTGWMSRTGWGMALAAALAAAAPQVGAQVLPLPSEGLVVSASWLASHLDDPNMVLLQVGDPAEYQKAHIAGARPVSLAEISAGMQEPMDMDHGLMLEMLPPDTLRRRLEGLGISDRSTVVVYFAKDRVSPATRVLYTLAYAGLGGSAVLLDGGLPAWQREGHPTVAGATSTVKPGTISARAQASLVVDADWVDAHRGKPGIALVDARRKGFFDGTQKDDSPRQGHIPTAQDLPFEELFTDSLQIRSKGEIGARFRQAGVQPGDTVVAYCHIGQRATAVLLAARILGYPVRLYDGSFQDWSRRPALPVATGGQ